MGKRRQASKFPCKGRQAQVEEYQFTPIPRKLFRRVKCMSLIFFVFLMFFVRSQGNPDWRVPPYKFTRAQMCAFKSLVKEVDLVIEGEEESREEKESE
jgi:hypothetical protein